MTLKKITETGELAVAVAIVVAVTVVVVGSCTLLLPIRWLIDWDSKRTRK